MSNVQIVEGDVLKWAAEYDGPKFHALLCDPPYELGFMGKKWDASGIAFRPETWAALAEHLHPGGFGMAFASSRGWHRMAVAIEDAGLIIHPTVFCWAFGSGFPKATRIDTAIDKAAGAEREVVGIGDVRRASQSRPFGQGAIQEADKDLRHITAPATDAAKQWVGHRYGLQALKPAVEPVIVFQKPYKGKPIDSITTTGAGALWIDGGRIGTAGDMNPRDFDDSKRTTPKFSKTYRAEGAPTRNGSGIAPDGRWPSNFTLSHAPDCAEGACVEECPVKRLGEQSGIVTQNDETAAAYFFNAQYEQIDLADPVIYQAKAGRKERDAGLDGMPIQVVQQGCAGAMPIDDQGATRDRFKVACRNPHPTVKPISLIRHLATLLLPPAEYAPLRIMIPFSGSGSECIGAMQAGWDEIVGIERETEYVEIARKRVEYWEGQVKVDKPPSLPLFE